MDPTETEIGNNSKWIGIAVIAIIVIAMFITIMYIIHKNSSILGT